MAALQTCYGKKINETNDYEKTVKLSYLRINLYPWGRDSNKWNSERFHKYHIRIYEIKSTFTVVRKKIKEMIKIDYTLVVTNIRNKRIILASWRKRKLDLYKGGGVNLADCQPLSYPQFQKTTAQCLQGFDGKKKKKSLNQTYCVQHSQIWLGKTTRIYNLDYKKYGDGQSRTDRVASPANPGCFLLMNTLGFWFQGHCSWWSAGALALKQLSREQEMEGGKGTGLSPTSEILLRDLTWKFHLTLLFVSGQRT